jgi:hypothetical protein
MPNDNEVEEEEAFLQDVNRRFTLLSQRKVKATDEYLAYLEKQVNGFLRAHYGYDTDAIPFDYLDVPPDDLQSVRDNLDILLHCLADVFHPASLVQTKLIQPCVEHVWRNMLGPLRRELGDLQDRLLVRKSFLPSHHRDDEDDDTIGAAAAAGCRGVAAGLTATAGRSAGRGMLQEALDSLLASVAGDVGYLEAIHELELGMAMGDDSSPPPRAAGSTTQQGPSDKVPVSGLVVNRLHRLENEHRTVLAHWARTC